MSEFRFVQYLTFKVDPAWRRLSDDERRCGREEFVRELDRGDGTKTYA